MGEYDDTFAITPMSQKLMLEAGEVYEGTVKVFAPAHAEKNFPYKVEVAPYGVAADGYEADLVTESERTKIVDWITIDEPLGTLRPNESKEIHYTIKVPETAPAGGQYAAIMVGSDERDDSNASGMNVKAVYEMASIIYATVNGDIVREGKIQLNEVPGFVTAMPVKVMVELENKGNIHETAKIQLKVKNFLTGAELYPTEGDDGAMEEVVMPETSRVVMREVRDLPALGIYEVAQNVDYMGKHSSVTQLMIACPVWFMVMVAVVLGVIIAGVVIAIKKHRKKKTAAEY